MKNITLSLSIAGLLSGSAAFAQTDSAAVSTAPEPAQIQSINTTTRPIVVDLPARKSRKHLLFSFGLFGMGVRMGWMKPKGSENPEMAGRVHGVGYPILNVSAGHRAFGLGTK